MISCLGCVQGLVQGLHLLASQTNMWHVAWLYLHYMTKKNLLTLPIPFQQCTTTCSGHLLTSRAQGDVWYTNYSVWTEPWKPGLKFKLFFCNFVFLLRSCSRVIECLCSLYLHVKTNIGSDSNIFATCMLHVLSCKTFRTGHKGVGIPNRILHWNVSWWLY